MRWGLKTGVLPQVLIEIGKASEAKSPIAHQAPQAGALEIFDLGYFSEQRFRRLHDAKAFFVSRLQHGTAVFDQHGQMAHRRRQKARDKARKRGSELSAEYSELLAWSLFVTNASGELLTWKEVVVLYRARWQIELLFKLWKSHNKLAYHRPGATAFEAMAVLWSKLIGVMLQHW